MNASFGGGHEQRDPLAAILEHDLSESTSTVDARVAFEHVRRTNSGIDVTGSEPFEDAIASDNVCRVYSLRRWPACSIPFEPDHG